MSIMTIASITMAQTIPSNNNEYENFQFFNKTPIDDYKSTNEYTLKKNWVSFNKGYKFNQQTKP